MDCTIQGLSQLKNQMISLGIEPELLACSIVPQPTTLPRAPIKKECNSFLHQMQTLKISNERFQTSFNFKSLYKIKTSRKQNL
jgi:hypothetical protein